MSENPAQTFNTEVSSVYGPVRSWRVGNSLGIDLICETSVCSFNCVYCQLGQIQRITNQRKRFVPTDKILFDFKQSKWQESDIITFSGSGEPTLALNIGEVSRGIKAITPIPQLLLTNGTLLGNEDVIQDIQAIDRIFVKVDAASEEMFQRVNRPAAGIRQSKIINDAAAFRSRYKGFLGIQCMFMPMNHNEVDGIVEWINRIQPDQVQLNTPTRPYPKEWHITSRGGHSQQERQYESVPLRGITLERAVEIEEILHERTGVPILSVYQSAPKPEEAPNR